MDFPRIANEGFTCKNIDFWADFGQTKLRGPDSSSDGGSSQSESSEPKAPRPTSLRRVIRHSA